MTRGSDVTFPTCCAHCPHRNPKKASCTHELRLSWIRELDEETTCPGFVASKAAAMQELSQSL